MKKLIVLGAVLVIGAMASFSAADTIAPEVGLRVNGQASGGEKALELWRGEPVIVAVALRNPVRGGKDAILLEPPAGGWATRVKVVVTDAAGKNAKWAFVVTGKPSAGGLALQPDAITTLVLRMEAKDSGALVPGIYQVAAKLELADGKGWRGVSESEAIPVEVVDGPAAPKEAVLGRRQILRVKDALLAGDLPRAEVAMKEMLKADVERPEGFVAMALISEAKGERGLALVAVDMAITRVVDARVKAETKPAGAPGKGIKPKPVPFEYYDLRQRIEMLPEGAEESKGPATAPATKGR
ncbi:MAG: hypothetical protein JWO87_572 [Phycisphaerales bacterium]|nr:hypothetical protein [Phycisphaerales bacterium]